MNEDLRNWFREKWVRMDTKGNIKGDCAREEGEGKPKCLPLAKASSMSKEKRAAAARRKRREDPVADRPGKGGKPVNVATEEISTSELIKKSHDKRGAPGTLKAKIKGPITLEKVRQLKNRPNATTLDKKQANFYINMHTEEYLEEKNTPTNPSLWSKAKSLAKQKFDVYPSAYANGWAAKWYKSKGGSWKSVQEEKTMKSLRDITEGVVVMSDYKLDKRGHRYKAHRKTMSPQVENENFNPYVNEEGDYPHVGVGSSKDMQMARDIATMKAKTSLLRSIHGDNFQDKTMPDYEEDKLDLKPDQKGGYTATVRMRQKAAAVKEDSNPYNDIFLQEQSKNHIQGQFINDDDWYVVHDKTKKIVGSHGAKSFPAKALSQKGGWGARSVKVDDEHTAYRGMTLKGVMKEESQINEVSKKTLAGYISGAAKDVGYHANLTGFVAGQKNPKGYNPTEESPKELKRHAGIAKALKRLVKEGLDNDPFAELDREIENKRNPKPQPQVTRREKPDEFDKAMMEPTNKDPKDAVYIVNGRKVDRESYDKAREAHLDKAKNPRELEMDDEMERMRAKARSRQKNSAVKENVEQVDELKKSTLRSYLKKAVPSHGDEEFISRVSKDPEEKAISKRIASNRAAGIIRANRGLKSAHVATMKEDLEQVDEISKATATSYVRKKLSQMGKRSGDTTPKDIDNLSRAYKRMGVSDKAMKEKE